MESKVKLMGHPVHPMLIVFPLGLLVSAVVCDVIHYATGHATPGILSFWAITGGVVMGLVAGVVGLVDWIAIPNGTRAKRIGLIHAAGNAVVLLLFAASWIARQNEPMHLPTTGAFVLEVMAAALVALTGWLGGELVYRLGVGVDYGSNLNATSSLSGKPALPLQARGGGQTKGGGQFKGPSNTNGGPSKGHRPFGTGPRLISSGRS